MDGVSRAVVGWLMGALELRFRLGVFRLSAEGWGNLGQATQGVRPQVGYYNQDGLWLMKGLTKKEHNQEHVLFFLVYARYNLTLYTLYQLQDFLQANEHHHGNTTVKPRTGFSTAGMAQQSFLLDRQCPTVFHSDCTARSSHLGEKSGAAPLLRPCGGIRGWPLFMWQSVRYRSCKPEMFANQQWQLPTSQSPTVSLSMSVVLLTSLFLTLVSTWFEKISPVSWEFPVRSCSGHSTSCPEWNMIHCPNDEKRNLKLCTPFDFCVYQVALHPGRDQLIITSLMLAGFLFLHISTRIREAKKGGKLPYAPGYSNKAALQSVNRLCIAWSLQAAMLDAGGFYILTQQQQ